MKSWQAGVLAVALTGWAAADEVWVADLNLANMSQGFGSPQKNQSVDKKPLKLAGQTYAHGVGTHAESIFELDLRGQADRFMALVGVDDEVQGNPGSVEFKVSADGKELFTSGPKKPGMEPSKIDLDIRGVKSLLLEVTDAGDGINFDHADWAEAKFTYHGAKPTAGPSQKEEAMILTPKPPATPRINGARIFGVRPGHEFLYSIAATGERPMKFAAENLPVGLNLDEKTGIITGTVADRSHRTYEVLLRASNALGKNERMLKIVVGNQIALTPPMGWNSWNCFAHAVSAEKVKAAAKAMVDSGLTQHGWTYINIDDFWEVHKNSKDPTLQGPHRDAQGRILPNPRFPNMKELTAYIHGLGLKAGLYSSPGPWTCGECVASFDHEELDAQSYAEWGFDYLKYDWCSYSPGLEKQRSRPVSFAPMAKFLTNGAPAKLVHNMRPYAVMRAALDKQPRDILFSFCQYGMGDVWTWGEALGGNCWRTTGDITDTWGSMAGIGFGQAGHEAYAGPGHWNDPDMLVVGQVGWGHLHPSKLTPNEQYTHISLWCLLCSPLLIGCDMTQLDDFTLGLLTNDEVLEVNQDPLGKQAGRVSKDGNLEVWAKKMEDGSLAVGLFNRGVVANRVTTKWSDLGISGKQRVRDLWRQTDIGEFNSRFEASVPRHGAVLVRLWPAK
jgi:alpha-galactosidase